MRAKFRCNAVTFLGDPEIHDTTRTYQLHAVYDNRTPENARFATATPNGELKMTISNPAARLQVGEDYYLDFTQCAIAHADAEPTRAPSTASQQTVPDRPMAVGVVTSNEFLLGAKAGSVAPLAHPAFTTRQSAYRFIAWLEAMAMALPDEDPAHTLDEIRQAIHNT